MKFIIKVLKYLRWHLILKPIAIIKRKVRRLINKISQFIEKQKDRKKYFEKINKEIAKIFDNEKSFDRIVIWKNDSFGWNAKLFQRPQHIARAMARNNTLFLYEVNIFSDNIELCSKLEKNLYLINFTYSKDFVKALYKKIDEIDKPKYIYLFSTELSLTVKKMKQYIKKGYKIIYDYIDDLSPAISNAKRLPKNVEEKYNYAMSDTENCIVVVTADNIMDDVKKYRDEYVYSSNGVDINHFTNLNKKTKLSVEMQKIIKLNKPIIGYYGALAVWFDYDLLKEFAKKRPDYEFVLIGVKYDEEYDKHNIHELKNIHFIGSIDYNILPYYAKEFDVCTIPFLINEITQATSPLKLYEYMALGKPSVTTAMHECMKHESVLIGKNHDDFMDKLDEALKLTKDKKYLKLLEKEANENSWLKKCEIILSYLKSKEGE